MHYRQFPIVQLIIGATHQAKKSYFIVIASQQKFVMLNSDMNSANKAIYYNILWKLFNFKFVFYRVMSCSLDNYSTSTKLTDTLVNKIHTG